MFVLVVLHWKEKRKRDWRVRAFPASRRPVGNKMQ